MPPKAPPALFGWPGFTPPHCDLTYAWGAGTSLLFLPHFFDTPAHIHIYICAHRNTHRHMQRQICGVQAHIWEHSYICKHACTHEYKCAHIQTKLDTHARLHCQRSVEHFDYLTLCLFKLLQHDRNTPTHPPTQTANKCICGCVFPKMTGAGLFAAPHTQTHMTMAHLDHRTFLKTSLILTRAGGRGHPGRIVRQSHDTHPLTDKQ